MSTIADLESQIEDLQREVAELKRHLLPKRRRLTVEEAVSQVLAERAAQKK